MSAPETIASFFEVLRLLTPKARASRQKLIKRHEQAIADDKEIDPKYLLKKVKEQEALIDFLLDGENGLGKHAVQLNNYRELAFKGLSFMSSHHELNGLFSTVQHTLKDQAVQQRLQPQINRLKEIFKGHMAQHDTYDNEFLTKPILKEYIETTFKGWRNSTITFDESFDTNDTEALIHLSKGFTIISNLIQNALCWGDHCEIKWLDDKIIISDNGKGVSEENQSKLFTYGFSERNHGHGIGLILCREYVREVRGDIYLDSDNNYTELTGASFVVDFKGRTRELFK